MYDLSHLRRETIRAVRDLSMPADLPNVYPALLADGAISREDLYCIALHRTAYRAAMEQLGDPVSLDDCVRVTEEVSRLAPAIAAPVASFTGRQFLNYHEDVQRAVRPLQNYLLVEYLAALEERPVSDVARELYLEY
jgi:hypothetical protein